MVNSEIVSNESDSKVESNESDSFGELYGLSDNKSIKINKSNDNVNKDTKPEVEFNTKGKNIKFDKYHNIKFVIGAEIFSNISDFLTNINLDVVFRIFKNKTRLYTVDAATTHKAVVEIKRLEFAEYEFIDIDDIGDDEINIYVDLSVIKELMIVKDHALDMYIDIKKEKRIYFVCGNDVRWVRLNSMTESDVVLSTFKNEENAMNSIMSKKDFQRIVMNYKAINDLLNSLVKKEIKGKESAGTVTLQASRDRIGYLVEDELKGGEFWCYGESIIVYPINECRVDIAIEYIKIFNKIKFDNQVKILMCENLPIILETRVGGGGIIIHFMIAPRIEGDNV